MGLQNGFDLHHKHALTYIEIALFFEAVVGRPTRGTEVRKALYHPLLLPRRKYTRLVRMSPILNQVELKNTSYKWEPYHTDRSISSLNLVKRNFALPCEVLPNWCLIGAKLLPKLMIRIRCEFTCNNSNIASLASTHQWSCTSGALLYMLASRNTSALRNIGKKHQH